MNTTIQYIVYSQQQEICWHESMLCSSDVIVG